MAQFTVAQERNAACILCPNRRYYGTKNIPCNKQNGTCNKKHLDQIRFSKKFRKDILSICHWLYDDDLHYFKIKD